LGHCTVDEREHYWPQCKPKGWRMEIVWIMLAAVALVAAGLFAWPFLPTKSDGKSVIDLES
jgi:hypothetical protein